VSSQAKKGGLGLVLLAVAFCLACILLIPVRLIGIGAAAVVAAITLGIRAKVRKEEARGISPGRISACFP
jgi:hypothetical protein